MQNRHKKPFWSRKMKTFVMSVGVLLVGLGLLIAVLSLPSQPSSTRVQPATAIQPSRPASITPTAGSDGQSDLTKQSVQPSAAPPVAMHAVKAGETLSQIADAAHLTWLCVARANHLSDPNLIHPGQHIRLACTGLAATKTKTDAVSLPVAPLADDAATFRKNPPKNPSPDRKLAAAKRYARSLMDSLQFWCFDQVVTRESGWDYTAENPTSHAYGLVQASPGSKMASEGANWRTNPFTQIKWGLKYMGSRYGSPCGAWAFWQNHRWF
jgi:LysM repeat protein